MRKREALLKQLRTPTPTLGGKAPGVKAYVDVRLTGRFTLTSRISI